jgi:hypothetical protein
MAKQLEQFQRDLLSHCAGRSPFSSPADWRCFQKFSYRGILPPYSAMMEVAHGGDRTVHGIAGLPRRRPGA